MKRFVISFLVPLSFAFSHDLWVDKNQDTYTLYYGHLNPYKDEQKYIEYNPDNVLDVKCFYQEKEKNIKIEKRYPIKIFGKCDTIFVEFSSGYWTKTPHGLKNLSKNLVQMPLESWKSIEYVKRVDIGISKPYTNHLEITSLDNLNNVKVGDKVSFLVTLNGKPMKDVVVAYDGKPVGTTDDDGRINIRIKRNGLQNITTSLKIKENSDKSDFIIYTSNLNFEVK